MDVSFLHRFGRALRNVWLLLDSRGFRFQSGFEPMTESSEYAIVGALYKTALQNSCSLAEALRSTFRKGHQVTMLWAFDRNYDMAKVRERMVSTEQVKALQELLTFRGFAADKHIVLAPNKLSPQAKKESLTAEIFLFDDLMIDLPRHELVLPHVVVSESEVKAHLGAAIRVADLPQLPTSDPIARWFGFPVGTLVRVDNPTMPAYRIVVEG